MNEAAGPKYLLFIVLFYCSSRSMIFLISLTSKAVAIFAKCSKLITVRVPLTISLIVDSRTSDISASFFCVIPFSRENYASVFQMEHAIITQQRFGDGVRNG